MAVGHTGNHCPELDMVGATSGECQRSEEGSHESARIVVGRVQAAGVKIASAHRE